MIEIFPMTEENYTDVADIEKACFFDRPWTKEQFHDELNLDFSRTFVAYSDNVAAGFVNVWLTPPIACINNIAVLSDFRRQGIADKLMEKAVEESRDCSSLTLEVRVSNEAAQSLYRKHGFSEVGRRKNFYDSPCEDALLMTKFFPRTKV